MLFYDGIGSETQYPPPKISHDRILSYHKGHTTSAYHVLANPTNRRQANLRSAAWIGLFRMTIGYPVRTTDSFHCFMGIENQTNFLPAYTKRQTPFIFAIGSYPRGFDRPCMPRVLLHPSKHAEVVAISSPGRALESLASFGPDIRDVCHPFISLL